MNSTVNINARLMIYGLVIVTANGLFVSGKFISTDNVNIFADIVLNELRQRAGFGIFGMKETEFTVTFADTDNDFFTNVAATFNLLLAVFLVHVFGLAANIGFVHLYRAVKHLVSFFHRGADTVTEIPCGLIAYAKNALHLVSRHSLARLAQKKHGNEPLEQGQVRIVENSAGRDSELIITVAAIKQFFLSLKRDDSTFAARAFNAVRPAQTL